MSRPLLQRTPLLTGDDPAAKRREIREYFHATQDAYERLFETLANDEAYYVRPIPLRHPLIFYYGHTAVFFINKLVLAGLLTTRIDRRLESLLAVGVDEMSWDDLDEAHYEWPTVAKVRAYRARMREVIDSLMDTLPIELPIDSSSSWWPLLMGIEHERIHLETSSVLIRQHALNYVRPHADWAHCKHTGAAPQNVLIDVPAGSVTLGKGNDDTPYYGWDNEYGVHASDVPPFAAARYLVSNAEYLGFVESGGYADESCWDDEGNAWRRYAAAQHPTFWRRDGSSWRLRLMLQEIAMPWDWPVEVNCHEARAFCLWVGRRLGAPVRLPSEDEWHRLYQTARLSDVPIAEPARANLHLDHWASSCAVSRFAHGEFYDVAGNVWQWTDTPIYPYPGFRVHPLYDDFSTPTFDGRHNLMLGGSWISCGNESLRTARYAFRRHFFQHAGFRYVVGAPPPQPPASQYETDKVLAEYAEFHYGDEYFGVANFPRVMAETALRAMGTRPCRRALDLGCAAGRASFELARHCDEVTGIDFSARFIGLGVQLATEGRLRYALPDEGELVSYYERSLEQLSLRDVRGKVRFLQGDACNLKPIHSGYDLILAANLIDRLYDPAKFLATVHQRINPGGLLVIASPYTWLEEHTPRAHWLGGYKKDGERYTTLDGLQDALGAHFTRIEDPVEIPFVIRETRRKFQHSLSELTIWERRRDA